MSTENQDRKVNENTSLGQVLKEIGLDTNWAKSIIALSMQEIAVKKRLDELEVSYSEYDDFQKVVEKLQKEIDKRNLQSPHILLSVARSYRHIRAKLMHDPQKSGISEDEAIAISNNTIALIKALFQKKASIASAKSLIVLISKSEDKEALEKFKDFSQADKIKIFKEIMEKGAFDPSYEWPTIRKLFEFLGKGLELESDNQTCLELFKVIFDGAIKRVPSREGKQKLLSLVEKMTRKDLIRNYIKETNQVDYIVSEFCSSDSFDVATINSQIILNLTDILSKEQVNKIVNSSSKNDQIYCSYGTKYHLKRFLRIHENEISADKLEELNKKLESS